MRKIEFQNFYGDLYNLKCSFSAKLSGDGYWSDQPKGKIVKVKNIIFEIPFDYLEDEDLFDMVYVWVFFNKSTWNVEKHGLIYTDTNFEYDVRKNLSKLGFSKSLVKSLSYTEQGMQMDDCVSMEFIHKDAANEIMNNKLVKRIKGRS